MVVGQLERGEKWSKVIEREEFEGRDTSWFKTQESIVNDIKAYEVEVERLKKEKETKSKGKK